MWFDWIYQPAIVIIPIAKWSDTSAWPMPSTTKYQMSDGAADSGERVSRWEAWLVAATFLAIAISSLTFVYRDALTSPWADELQWTPVIVGEQPATLAWLMQPHNGHCMPLVKLTYLGVGRATGFDFRGIALFSTLLLVTAALAVVLVVARMRGRASVLDILVPVFLLNWGHYMNLLWAFQLGYTLPIALACGLLLLLSASRPQLSILRAAAASVFSIAAAMCGGPGVFFLPFVVAWLIYGGVQRWRGDCPNFRRPLRSACRDQDVGENGTGYPRGALKCRAACVAILALAACTLLPLKFWLASLPAVQSAMGTGTSAWRTALQGTLQFLSMSLGKFGGETHPVSGLIVLALSMAAIARLGQVWRWWPEQRLRAAGLALFLGGALTMAIGAGLSRGFIGCLQTRYELLGCPLIVSIYLVGPSYGLGTVPIFDDRFLVRKTKWSAGERSAKMGLSPLTGLRWAGLAGLLLLAVLYDVKGLRLATDMRWCVLRMEQSVREGLPDEAAGVRHWEEMQDFSAADLARHLKMMREAGVGPYRRVLSDAAVRDVSVSPLLALEASRTPAEIRLVRGGEQFAQPFSATSALPLYRIDLETSFLKSAGGRLRWAIDEIDSSGRRQTRAEGESAYDDWPDPGYAHLVFTPFAAAPGRQLELRLCPDGAARPQLRLPQYRLAVGAAGRGIRAFAYYQGTERR